MTSEKWDGRCWRPQIVEASARAVANPEGQVNFFDLAQRLAGDLEAKKGLEDAKDFAQLLRYCSERLFVPEVGAVAGWSVVDLWSVVIDRLNMDVTTSSGRPVKVQSDGTVITYENDGKQETLSKGSMQLGNASDGPVIRKTHKDL